ncbi:MAG: hypothetical protein JW854_06555 [Actinobacteria bacterium]|nr:hypothetical protein [Actinomycetota bacterium]
MKEKKRGTGWTKGKILALVIPICLVVITAAVTLTVTLGGGGGGDDKAAASETMSEEEMIEYYEEIKQEAETALDEMEDLESVEAASDPEVYEQELEEALTVYNQLLADLGEAANAVVEVCEDYEELYAYIFEYYDYLYELSEQAVCEIEYLLTLLPTVQEIEQVKNLVDRLEQLPAAGQYGELSAQLGQAVQDVLANLEGTAAPDSLSSYGSGMDALARQLDALSQQMGQALASGDKAALASLADQIDASIASAEQQFSSTVSSLVSGYTSLISQLEAGISSAMP